MQAKINEIIKVLRMKAPCDEEVHASFKEHLGADLDSFSEMIGYICGVYGEGKAKTPRAMYNKNYKFLCKDLGLCIEGVRSLKKGAGNRKTPAISFFLLASVNKDILLEDYKANEMYKQDVDALYELIITPSSGEDWNQDVLNDIMSDDSNLASSAGMFGETMQSVFQCLGEMYSNTYGLYPYQGVFTFWPDAPVSPEKGVSASEKCLLIDKKNGATFAPHVPPLKYKDLYNTLGDNVAQMGDFFRQNSDNNELVYNIDEIIKSPSYYPLGCFALASGSVIETEYYKPAKHMVQFERTFSKSWDDYMKSGAKEALELLFARLIYRTLEVKAKTPFKFTDSDFIDTYQNEGADMAYLMFCPGLQSEVQRALKNMIKSVCSACVMSRNDDYNLFKIKICVIDDTKFTDDATGRIFDSPVIRGMRQDIEIENGVSSIIRSINARIVEYSFCKDKELMDKKPLFGFEAAKLFRDQRTVIDYNRILIGETPAGTPIFSTPDGAIRMQSKIFHRFSAGSRSGKGVMTMNILASSVSSGAALFYIDRKPDMGSELAYITGGNMFVVNGGDVQSGEDTRSQFINGDGSYGPMLARYGGMDKSVFKTRALTTAFKDENFGDVYAGAFGDWVYAKAVIFCMAMMSARIYFYTKSEVSPEVSNDLQLDRNVIVVFDEITNWHHNYEDKYFCTDPYNPNILESFVVKYWLSNIGGDIASSGNASVDEARAELDSSAQNMLKDAIETLRMAQEEYQSTHDEKTKKAVKTARSDVEKYLKEVQKIKGTASPDDEIKLFWCTYFDKYRSAIDVSTPLISAGVKPKMFSKNDLFMIGQCISGVASLGEMCRLTSSKDIAKQGTLAEKAIKNKGKIANEDVTASYMLGWAEMYGCDWFIGRNVTDKDSPKTSARAHNFGGGEMKSTDSTLDSWLHDRGNWAYVPDGDQESYRKGMPRNAVKFKPYLVLNTNCEPEAPKGSSPYNDAVINEMGYATDVNKYVIACAKRVGYKDWETLRERLIEPGFAPTPYGHLNDGIGLKGLIKAYKETDGSDWQFDPNCLSYSKQMADAILSRFGYTDYWDYLLDPSPMGLIGAQDIINMYEDPQFAADETYRLQKMFPRYYNTNNMNLLRGTSGGNGETDDESLGFEILSQTADIDSTEEPIPVQNDFLAFDIHQDGLEEPEIEGYSGSFEEPSPEGYSGGLEESASDGFEEPSSEGYPNDFTEPSEPIRVVARDKRLSEEIRWLSADYYVRQIMGAQGRDPAQEPDLYESLKQVAYSSIVERGY